MRKKRRRERRRRKDDFREKCPEKFFPSSLAVN